MADAVLTLDLSVFTQLILVHHYRLKDSMLLVTKRNCRSILDTIVGLRKCYKFILIVLQVTTLKEVKIKESLIHP